MIRIIAGKHGSRKLNTLTSMVTRPTLDQVKESFFNWSGPYFEGKSVLDGFGGSGAIGLEYLSRFAKKVVFVEKNKAAYSCIKQNVQSLNEQNSSEIYLMDLGSYLLKTNDFFDIVYLDPPYGYENFEKILSLLENHCYDESDVYIEMDLKDTIPQSEYFNVIQIKEYKRCKIIHLKKGK